MFSFIAKLSSKYKIISNLYRNNSDYSTIKVLNESQNFGNEVTVKGWIKSLRNMKKMLFIDLNDGSCNNPLQIVLKKDDKPENLTWGSSVSVKGRLNKTAKGQLELQTDEITVIGSCPTSTEYPFNQRQAHPPDYIRKYMHLRSRTLYNNSILRIRHRANLHIHHFFDAEGYNFIQSPILTSNDCEGAGEVFVVKPENVDLLRSMVKDNVTLDEAYFDKKVYLTVSGQLHLEALAHGLGNVYTFGPAFRAENSKSLIHLSEFYMIEAEKAFCTELTELTSFTEKLIKSLTKNIFDNCSDELSNFKEALEMATWLEKDFIIMPFDEAIKILETKICTTKVDRLSPFTKEHELHLVDHTGGVPIFVVDWPESVKPFYMRSIGGTEKVAAFDLLVPVVGELAGGGLRENKYDLLKKKLPKGVNLDWYLDLRRFGSAPTAGFGIGFERYLKFVLGINNIKDTIAFPRWAHNCSM